MSHPGIKIAPSILSADFSELVTTMRICDQGKADYIHIDIMDGNFVPNITIGPAVVESLRPHSDKFFDVHIMVRDPLFWVSPFVKAGADGITFHVEATGNPRAVIEEIHDQGKKAGISLRPGTNIELIEPYLEMVDLVLIMSVEPGFGGQKFIESAIDRIVQIRQFINQNKITNQVTIEVDGGIGIDNAARVLTAGADILVAGSAIFNTPDPIAAMLKFREIEIK